MNVHLHAAGAAILFADERVERIDEEREAARIDPLRAALDILDVIDGIVDDTHPEGDGCPLCIALDDLRAALAADTRPAYDASMPKTHSDAHEGCTCEPEHVWPCALIPRCDEPGCERETSWGWLSPAGYRRTCGEHYRAARLTEERP